MTKSESIRIFYRKFISGNVTHPQSYQLQAMLAGEMLKG